MQKARGGGLKKNPAHHVVIIETGLAAVEAGVNLGPVLTRRIDHRARFAYDL